jgi:hypothetical protein
MDDAEKSSSDDVVQAYLAQALALKTTAGVTTVDGGNIAKALRSRLGTFAHLSTRHMPSGRTTGESLP